MLESFSLNKWNLNNRDEDPDVCKHPGHVRGTETVWCRGRMTYFWPEKSTQWYIEGRRVSHHICDFRELPSLPLRSDTVVGSRGTCDLRMRWCCFEQGYGKSIRPSIKEECLQIIDMWFIGFWLKTQLLALFLTSSFKIMFYALRSADSMLGLVTLKYSSSNRIKKGVESANTGLLPRWMHGK